MRKPQTKTPTNRELAEQFGCDARTIRNWKRAGAPLHDPARMALWLSGRKNIPPNVKVSTPAIGATPAAASAEGHGAAAALTRLQTEELTAYQRLQDALASGDALGIRVSRENWFKVLEALRKYEGAVNDEQRRRNALVPRADVEGWFARLAYGARVTSEGLLPELVMLIDGEPDPIKARQIARRCLWHVATASTGFGKLHRVPEWVLKAYSGDLHAYVTGDQLAEAERFAEALKQAGEAIPGIVKEQG